MRRSRGTARHEAHRRAVRRDEDAAVKLATRRSLADVAEAAHQDVAEALALEEALTVSSRETALLEQREALNERLAIDASMMDILWRDEMPLQLQWLRQPASLLRLLQRPVWLDAWLLARRSAPRSSGVGCPTTSSSTSCSCSSASSCSGKQ